MAIAIVYMAKEFNWNHTTQGFVSSSFYFGYFTTQIIGGALTDKFGGRIVLGIGVGEGATFPCIQSLITKWFPPEERSRAISIIFVSNFIGMAVAMPISNILGSNYPGISKEELDWILESKSSSYSHDNFGHYQSGSREYITITEDDHGIQNENDTLLPKNQISSRPHYIDKIPWKLIFSRREVWAILLGQFFNSWGYYILLNWLPIFYYEHFHVDINLIGYYTGMKS
ncbi:10510_t:CDS:2 [Racocetra fulgida]|uniref:10510_t:CDS:1 n=1 Tax=Racocetra fulgida TaxID=60492 RepID=A0A9N9I836_9GLOM|nr:10510_t:CDS:2 [Racocetra fulgida]